MFRGMKNKEWSALIHNVRCIMILVTCFVFPVKGKFEVTPKVVIDVKEYMRVAVFDKLLF